jgi:hypothetical protein
MAWAGWGAGPAGAGSAGGPSKIFLGAMLLGSVVVTAVLARDRAPAALLAGAAAVYFGLRLFGVIGPREK